MWRHRSKARPGWRDTWLLPDAGEVARDVHDDDQRYTTWYEPFDQQEYIDAAVSFVLSREEITGMAMVGDVSLVPNMIEAEEHCTSREEAERVLADAPDYSSPFISMPF